MTDTKLAARKLLSGNEAIARAAGLICIPEGVERLSRGDVVPVQLLARPG